MLFLQSVTSINNGGGQYQFVHEEIAAAGLIAHAGIEALDILITPHFKSLWIPEVFLPSEAFETCS